MLPIIDLHADLLHYLADHKRHTIEDADSRVSLSQMQQGGVRLQILPIFTETHATSSREGKHQLALFHTLLKDQHNHYKYHDGSSLHEQGPIQLLLAVENASSFCGEGESLEEGLRALEQALPLVYLSLTWNGENRFGGGMGSPKGLKDDGKTLLSWMDKRKVAVDLSHASDRLADEIFNYIDKHSLHIPVIASHSNSRTLSARERNLPDYLAREIIHRKGLIGLNFFAPFLGSSASSLVDHVRHFLSLGGEHSLCFGADFFPDNILGNHVEKVYHTKVAFFQELSNASCYPWVLSLLQDHLSKESLENLAMRNVLRFINSEVLS
ncbi:MAG: peptidase [Chlamydiae bacterium]|nr:peptidase [Chlamydiota bacterium]